MKALDLRNILFGDLTAIEPRRVGKKRGWDCVCSCGNKKWVPTFQLTSGNNKTCGAPIHKQSIKKGDIFGKLVVVKVYRDDKNKRYMAECLCECGTVKPNASFRNLQRGATTHCGCILQKRKTKQPPLVSLRNIIIGRYKGNAFYKGLPFELTTEECEELFAGVCYFCGEKPSSEYRNKAYNGVFKYSSIDRIDSNKGYVKGNVASCCTSCNYFKGNKGNKEFLSHIERIFKYQNS